MDEPGLWVGIGVDPCLFQVVHQALESSLHLVGLQGLQVLTVLLSSKGKEKKMIAFV